MAVRWTAGRILALALAAVVLLAAAYAALQRSRGNQAERKLVIYTYESLLKWGDDPNATLDAVYGEFERRHGCEVEVREFDDARSALLALIQEKDNPQADVIIGIDNVLVHEAIEAGVLEPYTPSNLDEIHGWLISSLDPTHHVVPYDYGLIALVYDGQRIAEEEMSGLTFDDLAGPEYASRLVAEDPTVSSTGLGFLLWQIAYYKMTGGDWRSWWSQAVENGLLVAGSWGDAYDVFLDEAQGRPIVVSYGTDGAYSYHFYGETRYRATLVTYDGEEWGWLQIEGIGLVKGAPHRELAEEFIEFFLSPDVQRLIPLNNWMYPANKNVQLPPEYAQYAIDPTKIKLMNEILSPDEIAANLRQWLDEWRRAVGS